MEAVMGAEDATLGKLEQALDVRAAVEELPENCREIVVRFFLRDESYIQISEALDIPPGTIASRISRCLTKLRESYGSSKVPA